MNEWIYFWLFWLTGLFFALLLLVLVKNKIMSVQDDDPEDILLIMGIMFGFWYLLIPMLVMREIGSLVIRRIAKYTGTKVKKDNLGFDVSRWGGV